MTKSEKKVINNILSRIEPTSYDDISEYIGKPIENLEQNDIPVLINIYTEEITIREIGLQEMINNTLQYSDSTPINDLQYILMIIELENYNLQKEREFIDNQLELLNENNNPKTKTKNLK